MPRALRTLTTLSAALLGATCFAAPSALAASGHEAGDSASGASGAASTGRQPVASTPPMGWSDRSSLGCKVTAALLEQEADLIVSTGLRDKGYTYVDIDDCWAQKERDADGKLVPDPTKFPDGIKAVADYVHAEGLKLGIYADAGTATCQGYPGSLGHEQTDAQTFAEWGVDLLKYDDCNDDGTPAPQRYQAMSDAVAATGRAIVFSIDDRGVTKPWEWAPGVGDSWRIDGDITNSWHSVESIGRMLMRHYDGWSGAGFPDADTLEVGNGRLSPTEERTQVGLWSLYGAPLLLSTDLRSINADSLAALSDGDVIAVDQQAAGHAVHELSAGPATHVLARSMDDGSIVVGLYNESDSPTPVTTTAAAAGLPASPAYTVKDLWSGSTTTSTGELADQVPAHGLTLLRVTPAHQAHGVAPVVTFDAPRPAGADEYLAGPSGLTTTLSVEAPKGGGALTDLSVTLDVPAGWSADRAATQQVARLKEGGTQRFDWTLTPSGTQPATARATVKWTGADGAASRDVALRLTPTPATPSGRTSVAALPWLHAWSGYATPERNVGIENQPLSVAGQTYATGVGSHGESEVAVWLGGACSRLTTSVGLQDGTNAGGSVQGVVEGDGKELASSAVMTAGVPAQSLSVDVSGVDYLVLHTLTGDNSSYGDRIVWAGTGLACAGVDIAAPSIFQPGVTQDVTTGVTAGPQGASDVAVQLTGPAGWTVAATSPTTDATVAPGDTFSTSWAVTPPTGAAAGSYRLTAQASYVVAGTTVTTTKVLTLTVARSAHFVYSQKYDAGPSYKRLTREIAVPAGGGSLSFWTDYDTEASWDYLFVEAHTPGQNDWTTLPDANGHTSTATGSSCSYGWVTLHPQLAHYQTRSGSTCTPTGTTGSWNAATGKSGGWVQWKVDLSRWAGQTVEISLSYASDWGTNGAGVFLDDMTLPDGTTTGFEDGGLDGWSVPGAPAGEPANPNDYIVAEAAKYPAP